MTYPFVFKRRRDAQTLVFFLISFGTIILLCGMAIDSGMLYLAKARLSRAVDGAALVAVGNFSESAPEVASSMRDFAVANYSDLSTIAAGSTPTSTNTNTVTSATGTTTTITYRYVDPSAGSDAKDYRKYVNVVLTTGSGGQVTSATCSARCPAQTFFIGFAKGAFPTLGDLNVSSAAVASRNPRLIMVVVDRSASMLEPPGDNGSYGAFGLPQAVVTFLNFFVPGSDYIGIVSFGGNARLEIPPTTNFLYAATNNLIDSYELASNAGVGSEEGYSGSTYGVPGVDPEMEPTNGDYDPNYATTGVRRMKFGGDTAADDGIRMALECMMSNSGFNNPDVVKYMVIFTDGAWNNARTLLAAPTYTNWVIFQPSTYSSSSQVVSNTSPNLTPLLNNSGSTGIYFMPSLSPTMYYTNALNDTSFSSGITPEPNTLAHHAGDYWLSIDNNTGLEPLPGSLTTTNDASTRTNAVPQTITTVPLVGLDSTGKTNIYSSTLNVWVQPGAVDYVYAGGTTPVEAFIGDVNNPTNTVNIQMQAGWSNELIVPGYVLDGFFYDGLDLTYAWPTTQLGDPVDEYWPGYRADNYNEAFMWPDDQTPVPALADAGNFPFYFDETATTEYAVRASFMRSLLFRNYANQLTGFYIMRPDDPLGSGIEPLDSSPTFPNGTQRPLNGLGPYYPDGAVYWPFDLVGIDWDPAGTLTNALIDPDITANGLDRNAAWTINMLSAAAAPQWAGELFYIGTNGALSGTTAASGVVTSSAEWLNGAPSWLSPAFGSDLATFGPSNATITPNPLVLRPYTFRGTNIGTLGSNLNGTNVLSVISGLHSTTGGFVWDSSTGDVYMNTMCWNARPTHYYDFSKSSWVPIVDNHNTDQQALPLGYWKAQEYAWHARAAGVTIYTVGYGAVVKDTQNLVLAEIANASNVYYTNGTASAIPYNANQPIGIQYYADTTNAISNDFYQIGTAINAALTQ